MHMYARSGLDANSPNPSQVFYESKTAQRKSIFKWQFKLKKKKKTTQTGYQIWLLGTC